MSWVMGSDVCGALTRTAVAAAIAASAVIGVTVPATVTLVGAGLPGIPMPLDPLSPDDPACATEGWNPACFGGIYDTPADDGIPPAPAMVPNVDGSLSPPGTPGAI
ncbi:hypothetical protein [Mycolicibacterium mageritense]|uniref:hypothetical protein n=1 Tax=Mycolicibacterium mageritense TaxID=53462 RepID=UPI0011DB4C0E|nr:hypothetical protein [Mycolicibacterium mageritense]MBN3454548.1 hypothetical protein [Mycobacterium sp. DSM 3803]TXI65131.1 MAG: hypothetical protein E6Q55_03395 [Mycolicibacterium mageritense]